MSKSKTILFTTLFCLLFFTTELLALDSNESNQEKQKNIFSLGSIFKSLEGTVKGLSKSIGGTVDGVGEALGGTMEGIEQFVAENGEAVLMIGTLIAVVLADADSHHNNYGHYDGYSYYGNYGHNHYGYYNNNYCYNRW